MSFFLNLPFYGQLAVLIASSLLLTFVLLELVYRFVSEEKRLSSNDVTAFVFGSLGIFSALVISSVLVMAINHFDTADQAVANEANMLGDMDRVARGLSPEFGIVLGKKITATANVISTLEWDIKNKDANVELERQAVNEMSKMISEFEPKTPREMNYYQMVINRLGQFYDARRARSSTAGDSIAPQVLVVSLIVGLFTLVFALLYGAQSKRMHLILVSLLTAAMATTYSLILVFDSPFQGDIVVSNEPYLRVIANIKKNNEWDAQHALKVNVAPAQAVAPEKTK
jgi:hypothetical protein